MQCPSDTALERTVGGVISIKTSIISKDISNHGWDKTFEYSCFAEYLNTTNEYKYSFE